MKEEMQPNDGERARDMLAQTEFLAEHEAVEELIKDADASGDANLLDIYMEKMARLKIENPNAAYQLNRDRLSRLDKTERRTRFAAVQALRTSGDS